MPTPQPNESKDSYISKCMGYPDMQKYEPAQRRAICESMWENKGKKKEEK